MRLILHTLKKDIRHLWPVVMVAWLLLGALTDADQWRADWTVPQQEAWICLLLTTAWACTAALVVLEEPAVGDRHFWTTRPFRWPMLLGAKLVFLVLMLHLPSLSADALTLAARGFSPASSWQALISKQIVILICLTLPAAAIAALVRKFGHFVIVLLAIGAAFAVLSGGFQNFAPSNPAPTEVRAVIIRIVIASTAVAILCMQYGLRAYLAARAIAIAAALVSGAVLVYFPPRLEYALGGQAADRSLSTGRFVLRREVAIDSLLRSVGNHFVNAPNRYTVLLPITIASTSRSDRLHLSLVDLEVVAQNGMRITSWLPNQKYGFAQIDLMAYPDLSSPDGLPEAIALNFSGDAWERLKRSLVTVRGFAAYRFYRPGETTVIPTKGRGYASGLGRCTANTVDDYLYARLLKVLCESPHPLPVTRIILRHVSSGRVWQAGLNSARTFRPGPAMNWFSPLYRGQAFFHLAQSDTSPGTQWNVPANALPEVRVEITPDIATGHALERFEFNDVKLSSWLAPR